MTTYCVQKITVITPDSFNEFVADLTPNVVVIDGDGYLRITEIQSGFVQRVKVYKPEAWLTVETEHGEIDYDEEEETIDFTI